MLPTDPQELEQITRYMTQCYRKAKQRRKLEKMLCRESNYQSEADDLIIALYESALESMPNTTREIIVREFLDEDHDGWFYNYYTKSTFYRLRQKAIREFIDCMNV